MNSLPPALEPSEHLSIRQKQVLICAAVGLTSRQTAERLYISRRSIDRDVREVCEAFEVPTLAAAVLRAYRFGVIKDEHLDEFGT
jgi:two-component system secretion system response regulator SalR